MRARLFPSFVTGILEGPISITHITSRDLFLVLVIGQIKMAPVATAPTPAAVPEPLKAPIKPVYPQEDDNFKRPPANTLRRYEKAGVDISRTS